MAEYQAELHMMREKTARLRALRLARDAANNKKKKTRPATKKGAAEVAGQARSRRSPGGANCAPPLPLEAQQRGIGGAQRLPRQRRRDPQRLIEFLRLHLVAG